MASIGHERSDVATLRDPHEHLVTFYERDSFLVESVVDLLRPALDAGDPAIAIATGDHLTAIEETLGARTDAPSGTFMGLDAAATLERLMVDGQPDAASFREVIGGLLDEVSRVGGTAHLFGEMVAILWERGDIAGAVALEDLWNDLAGSRPFVLLCAYPMSSFEQEQHTDAFRTVCDKHSSVIPSESFSRLSGTGDRQRSEFFAMVIHDIRTPATIASGYLNLLEENWAEMEADEARDFVGIATENLERIQRLVDDVLTMSRIDSGEFSVEPRPIDLGGVVERTVQHMRGPDRPDIRFERPRELRAALADEDRQIQILTNLLSNALEFSPAGSPVHVAIDGRDDALVVSVRDEGVGISTDDQQQLFRPFSRVGDGDGADDGGTGLGLYIAKGLVEAQGGTLWVDSEPGDGATFSYTVPTAGSVR